MRKVKSERYGIIHAQAVCNCCDWTEAMNTGEVNRVQNLQRKARKHVSETGHEVVLETGNAIKYFV